MYSSIVHISVKEGSSYIERTDNVSNAVVSSAIEIDCFHNDEVSNICDVNDAICESEVSNNGGVKCDDNDSRNEVQEENTVLDLMDKGSSKKISKRHCAVLTCTVKNNNSSMFTFPKVEISNVKGDKNLQRCVEWIRACGNEMLLSVPVTSLHTKFYICALHFENASFQNAKKKNRLLSIAIPSKNCNPVLCFEEIFSRVTSQELVTTMTICEHFEAQSSNDIENQNLIDIYQHQFQNEMKNLVWKTCNTCNESFITDATELQSCLHRKRCKDYSSENDMDPGNVPNELKNLTYIEEQLIAKIHPVICVYKLKGHQLGYSGNVINFPQNVTEFAKTLPHKLSDLKCTLTIRTGSSENHKDFFVRAGAVRDALIWLKKNNVYYQNVEISEDNIKSLPEHGNVYNKVSGYDVDETVQESCTDEEEIDFLVDSSIPMVTLPHPDEQVQNVLAWPKIDSSPVNELYTEGYIAQAFPCLYPSGKADLRTTRRKRILHVDYFKHMLRYKDHRFARHRQYRFFALNSCMRWAALMNGNLFVHKNTEFKNMNMDTLKIRLKEHPNLIKKIMVQCSNVRGTKPYWNARANELKNFIEQAGLATVFFTLSAADLHWPELFKLLALGKNVSDISESERRRLVAEKLFPHILDLE